MAEAAAETTRRRTWPIYTWAVGLCTLVVVTLLLVGRYVPEAWGVPQGPGVFGDMFGVANALLSGLAFVGLIVAISLQRNEIALQRRRPRSYSH